MSAGKFTVTYRKSGIGYAKDQRLTLVALGLKKLNHSVEHTASGPICGMINKVRHLVSVDGVPADSSEGMAVIAKAAAATTEKAS